MIITIVAMTETGVIGDGVYIPWQIQEDLQLFNEFTSKNAVLMGSITYESIGKALPYRKNFVLSKKLKSLPDAEVHSEFEAGLNAANHWAEKNQKDVFIIGGSSVYKEGIQHSDKLYISFIKKNHDGDILFPEINWHEWEQENEQEYNDFIFKSYKRK